MTNLIKCMLISFFLLFNAPVMAFKCYITLMKSKCWNKHNVTLKVIDNLTEKTIFQDIALNKNTLWTRKEFQCNFT